MTLVTIDLEHALMGGGDEGMTLREAVIEAAARQVLADDLEIRQVVRDRVRQVTDEEIRAIFAPMLVAAIENSFQPTSMFGEPKGEPSTLREALVVRMRKFVTEPDPDARSPVGAPGGRRPTRVETFIQREVDAAVKKELREALDEAKAEVLVGVKEKAAEVIAETITKVALR